ncbi:prp2 [Symbiodinium sp. CCMP2592]|nr:prp2 [Symbiodinium sp. CCMP2592]
MGHCTFLLHDAAVRAVFELRDVDVGGRPIWVAEDSRGPPRPGAASSPTPQEALAKLLPAALGVAHMFPPPMLPVVSQRRGPGNTSKDAADPANRVFFSNVPYEISEEQLIELFQQVGTVLELNLFRNEMGRSRGMGHCVFAHPGSAERAIGELRDVNAGAPGFGRLQYIPYDVSVLMSGQADLRVDHSICQYDPKSDA